MAQLQTDLKVIQDDNLIVDGTFGSQGSQTYNAVIAFQKAHGLPQDGMVGPATKNALEAALSGFSVSTPVPEPLPPAPTPASPATTPTVPLNPSCLASTASSCGGFPNLPPDGTDLPNQIGKILTDFFG